MMREMLRSLFLIGTFFASSVFAQTAPLTPSDLARKYPALVDNPGAASAIGDFIQRQSNPVLNNEPAEYQKTVFALILDNDAEIVAKLLEVNEEQASNIKTGAWSLYRRLATDVQEKSLGEASQRAADLGERDGRSLSAVADKPAVALFGAAGGGYYFGHKEHNPDLLGTPVLPGTRVHGGAYNLNGGLRVPIYPLKTNKNGHVFADVGYQYIAGPNGLIDIDATPLTGQYPPGTYSVVELGQPKAREVEFAGLGYQTKTFRGGNASGGVAFYGKVGVAAASRDAYPLRQYIEYNPNDQQWAQGTQNDCAAVIAAFGSCIDYWKGPITTTYTGSKASSLAPVYTGGVIFAPNSVASIYTETKVAPTNYGRYLGFDFGVMLNLNKLHHHGQN